MTRFETDGRIDARGVCCIMVLAAALACGSDKTTGPPGGGGTTEQWVSAATRSWSVPAETESYKCHVELAATNRYYTGFRLASPSPVQTELYMTMRITSGQTGDYDCDLGALDGGQEIYAAGQGTTPMTFTGGKGVHVAAGQYVQTVTHLVNTTSSPVSASTIVEGRVAAAKDVTTPIDMFFVGRLNLQIPADSAPAIWNGSCTTADVMHIVSEIPLMRSLGVHQTFTAVVNSNDVHTVVDASFDPHHILYTSVTTDSVLPANTRVNASCTYVNHTGVVVNFGESAQNELCLFGIYRYPPKPPTSNSPFTCALGEPI